MTFEATYTLPPALLRRAGRQWIWRNHLGLLIGVLLVLAATVAALASAHYRALGAFLLGGSAMYLWGLVSSLARTRGASIEAYGELRITLDDHGVEVASAFGESSVPWTAIVRATITRDFVFLEMRHADQPVALPRIALTAEAMAVVERNVRVIA